MASSQTFRLRVTYAKSGRLAMLSHLEITHALERAVRRSGLPFALSQGFSPHMKLAYGSALPVGIGGEEEIFDITLTDYVPVDVAFNSLSDSMPQMLTCKSCDYIEPSANAASVAYPYSVYEAHFDLPIIKFEIPETIEVSRKKKTKTLAVRDYLVGDIVFKEGIVRFQLFSSNAGNLRPDVLLQNSVIFGAVEFGAAEFGAASNCAAEKALEDFAAKKSPVLRSISRIKQSEAPIADIENV